MQFTAFLIWCFAGAIAAISVGWLAAMIHTSGHAPIGLVSIGVGALLGALLKTLAATGHRPKGGRVAGRRKLAIGAFAFAILTIVAQHAWLYRDFRGQWEEARRKSAAAAMFPAASPPSPRDYFAHEWNPALWLTDAALIIATAISTLLYARRLREHAFEGTTISDRPKSQTPDP